MLHLDKNTEFTDLEQVEENGKILNYVIGTCGADHFHASGSGPTKKMFIEWDNTTYEYPYGIRIHGFIIQFVGEDQALKPIEFLTSNMQLVGPYEDFLPKTCHWWKMKEWADAETAEALSHLIKV